MKNARALVLCAFALLPACGPVEPNGEAEVDAFAGRDGRAEAFLDREAGKPLVVYGYMTDGLIPNMPRTVALLNCEATGYLSELHTREASPLTDAEMRNARSAFRFAKSYNLALLELRRAELERRCPAVTAQPEAQF